jgi:hypothetical protein
MVLQAVTGEHASALACLNTYSYCMASWKSAYVHVPAAGDNPTHDRQVRAGVLPRLLHSHRYIDVGTKHGLILERASVHCGRALP